MMTGGQYLIFRNRIDPILRACSVPGTGSGNVPRYDLAAYQGQTTYTKGRTFYFSVSRAKAHRGALLAICRDLPKLDAVLPGTACTITSLELVKRTSSRSMLREQLETAERLFALMTLADISVFRPVTAKMGITYLNADILYDYKDYVLP